ncbi:hypothetical protein RchiOBHm_Chr6g0265211 [Rosa chinensis]|uniref:Transmembrane protein n=1 Tax=Rosa chinensis TaxID=74649 RepID=A0A2P6PPE6_ROSCH|nr:hypothetical protein RchiOBHm_Chr6g0265211 [Rosa chinensis]
MMGFIFPFFILTWGVVHVSCCWSESWLLLFSLIDLYALLSLLLILVGTQ